MKITVNKSPVTKPFPKLMILKDTGSIILATKMIGKEPYGMLLVGSGINPIGDVDTWSYDFVDFDGVVTLDNNK